MSIEDYISDDDFLDALKHLIWSGVLESYCFDNEVDRYAIWREIEKKFKGKSRIPKNYDKLVDWVLKKK
jgi:hypothetical protein